MSEPTGSLVLHVPSEDYLFVVRQMGHAMGHQVGHAMGRAVGGAAAAGEGDVSGGGAPKKGPLQNSPLPKGTARATRP